MWAEKLKIRLEFNLALEESLPADFACRRYDILTGARRPRTVDISPEIRYKFPSNEKHERNYSKLGLAMRNHAHECGASLTTKRK